MTITAAPTVPNPNSATFAADAYPFTQWMAALGPEIDAETARINSIGFGAYSATSATSLTVGIGSKSLTIEAGKSFAVGQPVVIANTASPTNYMTGQVTSYNSGTGALVVNATAIGGSGTVAAWTISVASIVAGGGVSPDSIVVLTSGTSWTCPAGVTKVKARLQGAGGSGAVGAASNSFGTPGGAGGYAETLFTVVPATAYSYAIGAGGGAKSGSSVAGDSGGATTMTVGGTTVSAGGGSGGATGITTIPGGTATGGDLNVSGMSAYGTGSTGNYASVPPSGVLGSYGKGGNGVVNSYGSGPGGEGVIILELYKS